MTNDGWRELVLEACERWGAGDPELLDLVARLLTEQDAAKADLQRAGFGVCGSPWASVVDEVLQSR